MFLINKNKIKDVCIFIISLGVFFVLYHIINVVKKKKMFFLIPQ